MNKKQLLERQIAKDFINEANVFDKDIKQGPATQNLKRAGSEAVQGRGISALMHLIKALKYEGAYADPQKKAGLLALQTFIEKLNDSIKPGNLDNFKTNDIAIEAISQALQSTKFPSGDAELIVNEYGPMAGEFKIQR